MKKFLIIILALSSFSCFRKISNSPQDINHQIYALMQEYYLWYDKVPTMSESSIKSYTDPNDLIMALRYNEIDQWSYVSEVVQTKSLMSNLYYIGYGFIPFIYADNKLKVAYVYKTSDAWAKGIRRGDIIETYNGLVVESLTNYDALTFYSDSEGDVLNMGIKKPDGRLEDISVTNKIVLQDQILHHDVLQVGLKKVGYLAFDQFSADNNDSIQKVLTDFKSKQISDLILDLRYNGGGDVSVADAIMNSIIPTSQNGKLSYSYKHNDKNTDMDSSSYFSVSANNLNLSRLFVLVSSNTASASELIMNALSPYIDVIAIGGTTHGKPVGMYVWEYDNYEIAPVCFSAYNANGYGDFYDGLTVDVEVNDDLTKQLGDVKEGMLSYAVRYITTGSFDPVIAAKTGIQDVKWGKPVFNGMYNYKGVLEVDQE